MQGELWLLLLTKLQKHDHMHLHLKRQNLKDIKYLWLRKHKLLFVLLHHIGFLVWDQDPLCLMPVCSKIETLRIEDLKELLQAIAGKLSFKNGII